MIILFGIIMLILTCIQSYIGLKVDADGNNNVKNKRIKQLSILYFIILVLGVISFLFNESDKNKINSLIYGTSNKIDTINKVVDNEINLVKHNLDKTYDIIDNIDSLNEITNAILLNESKLINQYYVVNNKLKGQLHLEEMTINEREAIVELDRQNTHWDTSSLSICKLDICISNLGKRVATIEKGKGYILLMDKSNNINMVLHIGGINTDDKLQPNYIVDESYCYFSEGIKGNYKHLRDVANYAIIMLEVKFKDELIKTSKIRKTYTLWSPEIGFGGPKQWQKNMAIKWEEINYSFN